MFLTITEEQKHFFLNKQSEAMAEEIEQGNICNRDREL